MAPSLSKNNIHEIGILDNTTLPNFSISLEASNFVSNGHHFLTHVPANITATPSPFISSDKTTNLVGCFVGFDVDKSSDVHVVPIGKLRGIRFLSIFRFKVWWTTQWTGTNGTHVQHETQMMILEKNDQGRPFILLLPILEGSFRSSLRPGDHDDELALRVESGSTRVRSAHFKTCLYMHAGEDPYNLVKEAIKTIKLHLGTFKLLEDCCV